MKNDQLYPVYLSYLEHRMTTTEFGEKITRAKVSLLKISSSYFLDFKDRFDEDELFMNKILEVYRSEIRDKKLDDIFDDID